MWRPAKQDQRVQERDQAALVIRLQSGECVTSSESFASVAENDVIQRHAAAVVTDPPDDTASSLDPARPNESQFPTIRSWEHQADSPLQRSNGARVGGVFKSAEI